MIGDPYPYYSGVETGLECSCASIRGLRVCCEKALAEDFEIFDACSLDRCTCPCPSQLRHPARRDSFHRLPALVLFYVVVAASLPRSRAKTSVNDAGADARPSLAGAVSMTPSRISTSKSARLKRVV